MNTFQAKIDQYAEKVDSNLVLALDLPQDKPSKVLSRSLEVLDHALPYICAVKINRQLVLPLGLFDGVQKILNRALEHGLPTIMDCKINDIGNTNRIIAEYYFAAGFDAVTANPFVGWKGGLQSVFQTAKQMQRGVILLVYMSHEAAKEGYGQKVRDPELDVEVPQYFLFAKRAIEWNADGIVVGATFPDRIKEVSQLLGGQVPIYAPGIGVQGGSLKLAVKAGTRFPILGRTITLSRDPAKSARECRDAINACQPQ